MIRQPEGVPRTRKPRTTGLLVRPGTELNRRPGDFQAANLAPEMGTQVHQTTLDDVATPLDDVEL